MTASVSTGIGPASVGAPALMTAAVAPEEGVASSVGPLGFAECLGLCSPHDAGDPEAEPFERVADSLENSTEQDAFDAQGTTLPFFWTPVPQFAPPPPPPSSLPDAPASPGGNTVPADGEQGSSSGPDFLDLGEPDARATPKPCAVGSRPVETAAVYCGDTAGDASFANAKPFEVNATKTAAAGGVRPSLDQGGALAVATTADLPTKAGGEFIATAGAAGRLSNGESRVFENKNQVKDTDYKKLNKIEIRNGMVSAYGAESMSFASATSLSVEPPVAPTSSAPVTGELASAAVRLVERVAEVADLVRDTPAERVTLKLDLDDTHCVEVRVLMREGRVHAEFRSDSPEVRTALSSAWSDFTAKREAGSPVWAEPVFASLGASVALQDSARPSAFVPETPVNGFGREPEPGQGGSRRQARQDMEPRSPQVAVSAAPVAIASVLNQPTPARDRDRLLSVRA